ncbi:hypothetical protein Ddye_007676 [Dipteronia dyeriana]|uniref:Uncharacterized protein n=1 Tax=Dipteronia dyeriana TaxID=168575 RepID=A0AAD9XKV4_9ROSI|nr:hypothetical protein Ddye_007676 [Dipteronia dyeriana]
MATSPSQSDAQIDQPLSLESDSQLSSVVYDMSQQVQLAMTNMLKMISEVDQNSAGIMEEIDKCKNSVLEKKKVLEEEKEQFQKAAYAVLEMLNNRN